MWALRKPGSAPRLCPRRGACPGSGRGRGARPGRGRERVRHRPSHLPLGRLGAESHRAARHPRPRIRRDRRRDRPWRDPPCPRRATSSLPRATSPAAAASTAAPAGPTCAKGPASSASTATGPSPATWWSPVVAALAERPGAAAAGDRDAPGAVRQRRLRRRARRPGRARRSAVLGCGPVGLFTIAPRPRLRRRARAGLRRDLVPGSTSPPAWAQCRRPGCVARPTQTAWFVGENEGEHLDVVFGVCRAPRPQSRDAFRIVRNGGHVVLFGIPGPARRDRRGRGAHLQEPRTSPPSTGAKSSPRGTGRDGCSSTGVIDLRPLITHQLPLEGVRAGVRAARRGSGVQDRPLPPTAPRPRSAARRPRGAPQSHAARSCTRARCAPSSMPCGPRGHVFQALQHARSPRRGRSSAMAGRGEVVVLSSNNYLGLAAHPEVVARRPRRPHPTTAPGTASVRFICGTFAPHRALEEEARPRFSGTDAALTYVSCWNANEAAIPTLTDERDGDPFRRAQPREHRGRNAAGPARRRRSSTRILQMTRAERPLRECDPAAPSKLIVTDGVFSMEGDLARLPDILELARAHDAAVVVDDSHGVGVLGRDRPRAGRALRRHRPGRRSHRHARQGAGRRRGRLRRLERGGLRAAAAALAAAALLECVASDRCRKCAAGGAARRRASRSSSSCSATTRSTSGRARGARASTRSPGDAAIIPIIVGETAVAIRFSRAAARASGVFVTGFGYPGRSRGNGAGPRPDVGSARAPSTSSGRSRRSSRSAASSA